MTAPDEPLAVTIPSIGVDPVEDLKGRHLDLPIKGAVPEDVHDMFNEIRGGSRRHEAIDMLAPRHTPHLHFAIFKMTDKKWWQGVAIDPFQVWR